MRSPSRSCATSGSTPGSSGSSPARSRRWRSRCSTRPRTPSCCSAASRRCRTSSCGPAKSTAATVADVPILWVTASALSQEPSAATAAGMLDARGRRPHTVLDLDYRPTFWRSREEASARIGAAVDHATIAVGNREECAVAVGTDDPREAAARLRARGVELAIVKLGGDGVLLSSDGRAAGRAAADRGAVRPRRRRRVRRGAVPRAAARLAARAHGRVRERRRRNRGLAAAVLAGDAVRGRGRGAARERCPPTRSDAVARPRGVGSASA